MTRNPLTENTRDPLAQRAQAPTAPVRLMPALTVIAHPDPRLIGRVAHLEALTRTQAVPLSRVEPLFAAPDGTTAPLLDTFLSRKPLFLLPDLDGGVALDRHLWPSELCVAGGPLDSPRHFSLGELEAGVTLTLANRVVLLLHLSDGRLAGDESALGMIGAGRAMIAVREQIRKLADQELAVLIRGETGTGKELVAQALHRHSPRARGVMVSVNLGALPASLAHSEFFGASSGAFTGAKQAQPGYFLAAQDGTLFLDELGEAGPEVQALLLRVLETGIVYPLGTQRAIKVNPRLIAATDADLEAMIQAGQFRQALLQRLNAYEIRLAPLRHRREDIGRLVRHFLAEAYTSQGDPTWLARRDPEGSPFWPTDLAELLCRFDWPGNLRQLRHFIQRLVLDSDGRPQLAADPATLALLTPPAAADDGEAPTAPTRPRPREIPRARLEEALAETAYEPAAAARLLGISRASIYNMIRRHPDLSIAADLPASRIREELARTGDIDRCAQSLRVSRKALQARIHELGEC